MYGSVKVWQEIISLPTWTTGAEDPNPMFLEKRVYQGSSGSVYPYGVIDTLTGEREMRDYQAVWMENDFLRVMLLPELGGRIHRAYDKVKQRDFVYYNEVVKPALVGLLGPWISGGIEFNWPQHHRPTTFKPVDFFYSAGRKRRADRMDGGSGAHARFAGYGRVYALS
ncbi:putative transferase [Klebsiella pneumoniae subsp. pneumoniae]|nr:putative transferase [Klebsiella pneumoniae subsp. pneumoniae]